MSAAAKSLAVSAGMRMVRATRPTDRSVGNSSVVGFTGLRLMAAWGGTGRAGMGLNTARASAKATAVSTLPAITRTALLGTYQVS